MKVKSSRRLVRRLGLALAVTALMVPAAGQAMTMNASYESGGGVRLYADDLHASLASVPVQAKRLYADDLYASLAPAASRIERQYADVLRSNPQVSTKPRNFEPINPEARPDLIQPLNSVVTADSTGFDWSDAGIGAAGAFGLMLLGIGVLLVGRYSYSHKGRLAAT